MSETTKRIFCFFPVGRDPQRATGSHWAEERDYGTNTPGCCRGLLCRHSGVGPGNLGGGRGKGFRLTGRQPSQETLKRKTCKRVQPFPPGQDTLPKSPPTSCTSSAGTQNNFTGHPRSASMRPNKAAWRDLGKFRLPQT